LRCSCIHFADHGVEESKGSDNDDKETGTAGIADAADAAAVTDEVASKFLGDV
jgi:hypothetical protein